MPLMLIDEFYSFKTFHRATKLIKTSDQPSFPSSSPFFCGCPHEMWHHSITSPSTENNATPIWREILIAAKKESLWNTFALVFVGGQGYYVLEDYPSSATLPLPLLLFVLTILRFVSQCCLIQLTDLTANKSILSLLVRLHSPLIIKFYRQISLSE